MVWEGDDCLINESFFHPRSIVIIGASASAGRIGSGLVQSMLPSGIELLLLNPNYDSIFSLPCYHSLSELPKLPSHAFIAVKRELVLPYLRECAGLGVKNVVIISAGFKEKDARGAALEEKIRQLAAAEEMSVLGPNTLGFIHTAIGFNGTFLPSELSSGPISVISQSGGVGMALLSALRDQRCGLAKWVGIGNEAGVTALEALDYLADDPATKAIAVCFEGLRDLGAFLRRASEVNRNKPVVLLRDGKSGVGLRAAASHTGAMVYAGNVLPSLFRQFGLLEASWTRDCAVMLKALSLAPRAAGKRAVLLTNTAGPSVLAADIMEANGVSRPPVPDGLSRAIDEASGLAMELKNPADISSNGLSPRNYGIAAKALLSSDAYDLLLGFFSLNAHLKLPEHELTAAAREAGKPAVACFLAAQSTFENYPLTIEKSGIPCFCDPHDAAVACSAILSYGEALRRTESPLLPLSADRISAVSDHLASFGSFRTILSERESKTLLLRSGVELMVPPRVETPHEAADEAARRGFPVALKLDSSRITHKSAVGGVRLSLCSEQAVFDAAAEMLPRLRALDPDAALSVQPMAGDGFELILGAVRSPLGVLLMAGMGGRYAEALQDRSFCLLPASRETLERMLRSLRCSPVLYAADGTPRFDEAPLLSLLSVMSALMERFPRLGELEINPCRITKDGICVLDARAVLSP